MKTVLLLHFPAKLHLTISISREGGIEYNAVAADNGKYTFALADENVAGNFGILYTEKEDITRVDDVEISYKQKQLVEKDASDYAEENATSDLGDTVITLDNVNDNDAVDTNESTTSVKR